MEQTSTIRIRPATVADREALRAMQALSMCVLGAGYYSPGEIAGFVAHVGTMDDFLLHEGTYCVATRGGEIVASGGWSRQRPNYANATGPAGLQASTAVVPKVRSVFVHPAFARRGLATRLMERAEAEASTAGYDTIELTATLSGVPLYERRGYVAAGEVAIALPEGLDFAAVPMKKPLSTRLRLSAAG